MKFRGKIEDQVYIRLFSQLMTVLKSFSKTMVLRVQKDKMAFLLSAKGSMNSTTTAAGTHLLKDTQTAASCTGAVGGGAVAWCEIPVQPHFSDYSMEGIPGTDVNEIYLEIAADGFANSVSSLKQSSNVKTLKLKLTKKIRPCLTLEIESETNNTTLTVTHDIPVSVISRRNWGEYACPVPPRFNISLSLGDMKHFRLAMERMRNIGPKLIVKMNDEGSLVLSVESYNVQSTVKFQDLGVCDVGEDEDAELPIVRGSQEHFSVEVDMKSVFHLLPSEGVKPSSIIISIADSCLFHCLLNFGEAHIEYFVPGSVAVQ